MAGLDVDQIAREALARIGADAALGDCHADEVARALSVSVESVRLAAYDVLGDDFDGAVIPAAYVHAVVENI